MIAPARGPGLIQDPSGVIVAQEIATDFAVGRLATIYR